MNSKDVKLAWGKGGRGDGVQGLACLFILWYIMFGDPIRLPTPWLSAIPRGPLTTPTALMICMAVLYFIEGTKAADWGNERRRSPVGCALSYYISYWMVCAPLVLIGGLFFCEIVELPIYSPMFRNLGFLNVSRAVRPPAATHPGGDSLTTRSSSDGFTRMTAVPPSSNRVHTVPITTGSVMTVGLGWSHSCRASVSVWVGS